jgi:hypothetical protein
MLKNHLHMLFKPTPKSMNEIHAITSREITGRFSEVK